MANYGYDSQGDLSGIEDDLKSQSNYSYYINNKENSHEPTAIQ